MCPILRTSILSDGHYDKQCIDFHVSYLTADRRSCSDNYALVHSDSLNARTVITRDCILTSCLPDIEPGSVITEEPHHCQNSQTSSSGNNHFTSKVPLGTYSTLQMWNLCMVSLFSIS